MAYVPPQSQPAPTGGLLFVNPPGAENYRALRVDVGDQHLFWQSTYQHLLRVDGAFGEFFPQAEFADNGNRVVFTKHIEGVEVLAKSRVLRSGERIPRAEWLRFLETWKSFKRLGDRTDIPDDNRAFISKFSPPSFDRYPQAYRLYRPHWYSRTRLFILWGLEPVGGGDFTESSPEEIVQEVGRNVESTDQERGSAFLRWLRVAFVCLFGLALLLLLVWALLPRPIVDFEVDGVAKQPAKVRNLTQLDAVVVFGSTSYAWRFDQATPVTSEEFEPAVTWEIPGERTVVLDATQSTLWGLLYKTSGLSKVIQVKEPPKPPVPEKEDPTKPSEKPPGTPALHGFGTVDKPSQPPNGSGDGGQPLPKEPVRIDGKPQMGPDGQPLPGTVGRPLEDKPESVRPVPGRSAEGEAGKSAERGVPAQPKMGSEVQPLPDPTGRPLENKPEPGRPIPGQNMPGEAGKPSPEGVPSQPKNGPDGKPMAQPERNEGTPLDPKDEVPTPKPTQDGKPVMPKEEGKPAPAEGDGEMKVFRVKPAPEDHAKPGEPTSPSEKSDGGASVESGKGKAGPGLGVMPAEPRNGQGVAPGAEKPSSPQLTRPKARSDGKPRALPMPELEISGASVVDDGKSQDIDFRLRLPAKVRVERLSIDGKEVSELTSGGFRARLGLGRHDIHIEYRSEDGEVREDMMQEMLVDQDEIKTYRPKSQLGEKKKVSAPPPSQPEPAPSKSQTSETSNRLA